MDGPKTARMNAVISQNVDDMLIPGVIVEVDPDMADRLGAFEDDALDDDAAWESNIDLIA